jgi:hypothetical protein
MAILDLDVAATAPRRRRRSWLVTTGSLATVGAVATVVTLLTAGSGTNGAARANLDGPKQEPVGSDDAWSLTVRASTTPGLVCQDLTRQGAFATTAEGLKPLTVTLCSRAADDVTSYHWAYVDDATKDVIAFGRLPAGASTVDLTAGGQAVRATIVHGSAVGVTSWFARVRQVPSAGVVRAADGSTSTPDLTAELHRPCSGLGDVQEIRPTAKCATDGPEATEYSTG